MTHKPTFTAEEAQELIGLLNNEQDVPMSHIQTMKLSFGPTQGHLFLSRLDLIRFLKDLEDVAMSDQKQEAYKGLREYLMHLK